MKMIAPDGSLVLLETVYLTAVSEGDVIRRCWDVCSDMLDIRQPLLPSSSLFMTSSSPVTRDKGPPLSDCGLHFLGARVQSCAST